MSSIPAAAPRSAERTASLAIPNRGALVARAPRAAWLLRALLVGGVLLAVATVATSGDPAARLRADPGLATLLRGMAVIKALLTAVAVGVLCWRFGRPISRPIAAAYLAGSWCMAAASMVVWRLNHVGFGAIGFHSGELTLLFLAWLEHRRETVSGARSGAPVRRAP